MFYKYEYVCGFCKKSFGFFRVKSHVQRVYDWHLDNECAMYQAELQALWDWLERRNG